MKKVIVSLLTLFSFSFVSAQKILIGDMNGDNELTVLDVTELVNTINGKVDKKYAYSALDFIKENKLTGRFKINGVENNYIKGEYDPYNCRDYVDLGLSVKWATCNVGALSPESYGAYFAWGETAYKASYQWSTYAHCNGSPTSITKYCQDSFYGVVDNLIYLETEDDAAHVNWGGDWRMPTKAEQDELRTKCSWQRTKDYNGTGVAGYIVTSNVAGYTDKSIFLPAAGCINSKGVLNQGSHGYYWSNQLYPNLNYGAYSVYLTTASVEWDLDHRYYGMSVRAVCP